MIMNLLMAVNMVVLLFLSACSYIVIYLYMCVIGAFWSGHRYSLSYETVYEYLIIMVSGSKHPKFQCVQEQRFN
jgi:hypothetical protein